MAQSQQAGATANTPTATRTHTQVFQLCLKHRTHGRTDVQPRHGCSHGLGINSASLNKHENPWVAYYLYKTKLVPRSEQAGVAGGGCSTQLRRMCSRTPATKKRFPEGLPRQRVACDAGEWPTCGGLSGKVGLGSWPVSISTKIMPRLKTSLGSPYSSDSNTSGDMNSAVPAQKSCTAPGRKRAHSRGQSTK